MFAGETPVVGLTTSRSRAVTTAPSEERMVAAAEPWNPDKGDEEGDRHIGHASLFVGGGNNMNGGPLEKCFERALLAVRNNLLLSSLAVYLES